MPPLLNPRLVNTPFGDPALFIPFFFSKRALLFDIGDISQISPKEILKITHCFVTHTHMDHFIGFDNLVRIMLGREKELYFYGPEGFHANVEGKLSGYSWNLVENYSSALTLVVTELQENRLVTKRYDCKNRFSATDESSVPYSPPLLYSEKNFSVETAVLEHDIPCLGFAIKEHFRVNIRKEMLQKMGLEPGKWLFDFKQMLYEGHPPDTPVPAMCAKSKRMVNFELGELSRQLALIKKGGKIAYVTDVAGTKANIDAIEALAKNCNHLFIEATFLEKDRSLAKLRRHLTACQAGTIAAATGAGRFTIFHFSPRYKGKENDLQEEAMAAFRKHRECQP